MLTSTLNVRGLKYAALSDDFELCFEVLIYHFLYLWDILQNIVHCYICQVSPLSLQAQQVFVDADSPIIRKKIKKLSKQEPFESRVVWRELTESLARDDSEAAGEAKHAVSRFYSSHGS